MKIKLKQIFGKDFKDYIDIPLNPTQVAEAFWELDADQQAAFFNSLGLTAGSKLPFQLQYVTESRILTGLGRNAMQLIGDYAKE